MLKEILKKNKSLRKYYKSYTYKKCLVDWNMLTKKDFSFWRKKIELAKYGPKILIATAVSSQIHSVIIESLLAAGLILREADVHVFLCDSSLPACFSCMFDRYKDLERALSRGLSNNYCDYCFPLGSNYYRSLDVTIHRFSQFVSNIDMILLSQEAEKIPFNEIAKYKLDGVAVGEHALAGALRFYARGTLDGEKHAESVLRQYFKAALITAAATRNLIKQNDYRCAIFSHGIYVPHGIIGEVCRQYGISVVNWVPSYRKKTFIFSHGDTYHHTLMNESVKKWENIPWTKYMESELMSYLKSRWTGKEDWIWFSSDSPEVDLNRISKEIGADFSRPCIGLLTNVTWDAQIHYPENIFPNMIDWIIKTISYFNRRKDLQLIIRVHPAEIKSSLPSRQKVVDEIQNVIKNMPENVFIIPPESKISTYAAMSECNAAIIYGTKTGVELVNMGIPVIVAGEAWIKNKGITIDATSEDNYYDILDRLPLKEKLNESILQRARKYAYHFFFRRMIPIDIIKPIASTLYKAELSGLDDIMPGRSNGFDIIIDGILNGTDFIYRAEEKAT